MKPLTFVHLSDLHFGASNDFELKPGLAPLQQAQRALARVRQMEIVPDFILVSGDLVNDGTDAEYETANRFLEKLRGFDVPLLVGLGNHDETVSFRRTVLEEAEPSDELYYYSQQVDGLNVIMLDSHVPQQSHGHLDEAQLAWLADQLANDAPLGHLIVLHHSPVHGPVEMLNSINLDNPDALAAVIEMASAEGAKIVGLLNGHIHYPNAALFAGILAQTAPAVAYTIDAGVQQHLRQTSSSGFAIGTVLAGRLNMNVVMLNADEREIGYLKEKTW